MAGRAGLAAYALAFKGDAVSAYVLVDAAVSAGPAGAVAHPEQLKEQLGLFALYQRAPEQYLRGMMNAIIRSPRGRQRIDEYVRTGLRTPPDLGVGLLLMDFIAVDRRPGLAAFDRPTLIIAAAQSGDLEAQREMSRRIPGARFETIVEAGHAVFLDQPQRFYDVLASFVQRVGAK